MLKFCSLASGSSGNCYYVATETVGVLIDAGISRTRIAKSLQYIGEDIERVSALFITHEHSDHISGLRVLLKKNKIDVYMTEGTYRQILRNGELVTQSEIRCILPFSEISVGDLTISCFPVSHDAADPVCYKITAADGAAVGIITDLGWADPEVIDRFSDVDLLLLESNHDVELLKIGPYPPFLKKRILSKQGHLSNESAATIARHLRAEGRMRYLILGHLSEVNNHPDLAYETVNRHLQDAGFQSGEDYELEVSLRNQVGKLYRVRRLLCALLLLLTTLAASVSPAHAEEILLREQVKYDIPILGVVHVEGGTLKNYVSRKLSEGKLSDSEARFQAGPLARAVTSLALLQLMEKKGISLEDPIAAFAPQNLGSAASEDLDFVDLFVHTTGFTDSRFATLSTRQYETAPSERAAMYLKQAEKPFKKGRFSLQNRADFALMTLLIESISGMPFEEYMREFFDGIGMTQSTMESPEPDAELIPRFYVSGGERLQAPPYHALIPAADDFITTLGDMERLMLYLTDPKLPRNFHVFSGLYTNINEFTARSTVFNYVDYDGVGVFLLDSGLPGAHMRLAFIPEKRVGFFLYYNSDHVEAREGITQKILEEYREGDAARHFEYIKADHIGSLVGYYRPLNLSARTREHFIGFSHQLRIDSLENSILIEDDRYQPLSETVYYSEHAQKFARFVTDEEGRLRYLVLDNELYQKAFSGNIQLSLLALLLIVTLLQLFSVLMKWRNLIAGRVDDRPRVWWLFAQILLLIHFFLLYFTIRQTEYWAIAYAESLSALIFKYFGWSVLLATGLHLLTWGYTRRDYKWRGYRFLMWLSIVLSVFFMIWLVIWRLVIFVPL